ncbi:MAG TPA: hypothetical protein VEJ16_05000 [Alphaproteobacteria bacterium]|nr:hypothetical protein [Alphaproteobacteria bacterium]
MDAGDSLTTSEGQGRNILQLLALFLLLLSFFILLNSLSSFEPKKIPAVLGSVNDTFSGWHPIARDHLYVDAGNRAALEQFQSRLREALLSTVPEARLEGESAGGPMRVRLHADELFAHGGAALRPDRALLLNGLAEALNTHPADLRFDIELVFEVDGSHDAAAIKQAESLARALADAGAPEVGISIGLRPGNAGVVELAFQVRHIARPPNRSSAENLQSVTNRWEER